MNCMKARQALIDELEEAGLIRYDRGTWVFDVGGKTYLLGLSMFDVTDDAY